MDVLSRRGSGAMYCLRVWWRARYLFRVLGVEHNSKRKIQRRERDRVDVLPERMVWREGRQNTEV